MPDRSIKTLQRIQNAAVRALLGITMGMTFHQLASLHWLPVKSAAGSQILVTDLQGLQFNGKEDFIALYSITQQALTLKLSSGSQSRCSFCLETAPRLGSGGRRPVLLMPCD